MSNKLILILALSLLSSFLIPLVFAKPVFDVEVKDVLQIEEPVSIFAGENIPIKVKIRVFEDIRGAYLRAELEHSTGKISALSSEFDLEDNVTYVFDVEDGLYLGIPQDVDIDNKNKSVILVQLENEDGRVIKSENIELKKEFKIVLDREANNIKIQNVTLPDVLKADERTLVAVTLKNLGENIQNNLQGQLKISSLGILSKVDIGSIDESGDNDDEKTVYFPLIIPKFTSSGTYTLELKVFNDKISTSYSRTIDIDGQMQIVRFTEVIPQDILLDVQQDERAVFKISILNLGNSAQTYRVSLGDNAEDWGIVQINPSIITLNENQREIIEIYASPNSNILGEKIFNVKVTSEGFIKEFQLAANVKERPKLSSLNLKLISFIVVFVLLILISILFRAKLKAGLKKLKAVIQKYKFRYIRRKKAEEKTSKKIVKLRGGTIAKKVSLKTKNKRDIKRKNF